MDTNTIFTGLITQEDFIAKQLEIIVLFKSSNSYNVVILLLQENQMN